MNYLSGRWQKDGADNLNDEVHYNEYWGADASGYSLELINVDYDNSLSKWILSFFNANHDFQDPVLLISSLICLISSSLSPSIAKN